MPGMTDRDHFAAAALTGFASQPRFNCGSVLTLTAKQCYELADAMLRERARTNLDAAPAAIVPEPEPSAARRRPAGGTGKTNHDAAPAATASVESVAPQPTTGDRAGNPPSHSGTGDTPKPIKGGVSDRSKPINGPDPDSRVWETPVHTPAPHATPGEGSVPREGTQEPVAWAVCTPSDGHWSPCYFHEPHAQRCANAIVGEKNVVPLYRHPPCQDASQKNLTLTDAEREAVERAVDSIASTMPYESQQGLADWKTLRGLLRRLGGGGVTWYQQYWGAVGAASDSRKELKAARRLRMTKAERQAVEYYIGTGGPKAVDAVLRRLVKRHGAKK